MKRILAALAAFSAMVTVALAEDAPPLIRDFEPAVTEATGTHMFRQDQFAWKATDILLAKHSADELRAAKAHGWIVVEGENRNVVRFIREGAAGPEAAYDVTFGPFGTTELTEPADRTLPPEQLAQYRARMLALENFDFRCTNTPPNSIAFKDAPDGDWRVWVMTATTDPKLTIFGGHIRYIISADGKSVLSKEKLSKSCLAFENPKSDDKPNANAIEDFVSLRPLETHVFANYAYRTPLFVYTLNGVTWKIIDGMIRTVEADDEDMDGEMARNFAGRRERCQLVVGRLVNGETKYTVEGETNVIEATKGDAKFTIKPPQDGKVISILCHRRDLVPSLNDDKVLKAGYALYIGDEGVGRSRRMGALELASGAFRFRLIDGEAWTGEQEERIKRKIDLFNKKLKEKP